MCRVRTSEVATACPCRPGSRQQLRRAPREIGAPGDTMLTKAARAIAATRCPSLPRPRRPRVRPSRTVPTVVCQPPSACRHFERQMAHRRKNQAPGQLGCRRLHFPTPVWQAMIPRSASAAKSIERVRTPVKITSRRFGRASISPLGRGHALAHEAEHFVGRERSFASSRSRLRSNTVTSRSGPSRSQSPYSSANALVVVENGHPEAATLGAVRGFRFGAASFMSGDHSFGGRLGSGEPVVEERGDQGSQERKAGHRGQRSRETAGPIAGPRRSSTDR